MESGRQVTPADPASGGRRSAFWNSLAGMITAIAALITALVGLIAFLHGLGGDTSPPTTSVVTPPTSAAGPGLASPGAPAGRTAAGTDAQVVWHRRFLFNNDGVELDGDRPVIGTGGGFDIYSGGESVETAGSVKITPWPSPADPTRAQCAARLQDFPTSSVSLATGKGVCIQTSAEQVAFMKVLRKEDQFSWEVDGTLWRDVG